MSRAAPSAWARYSVAFGCAAVAALIALGLPRPVIMLSPFFPFYISVAVSAWFGGFGPGVLTMALGGLVVTWGVLPAGGLGGGEHVYLPRLVLFTLSSLLIAALNGALHATQRKLAAEAAAARRSAARARRLAEANLLGVFFSDLQGNVSAANDEFLRLVGFAREQLEAGQINWHDLTAPEHRARDVAALAELQHQGVCVPFEKDHLLPDGRHLPVLNGYGRIEGEDELVGFVLDLTERKRAETEARSQRERLAAMSRELMLGEERERRRIAMLLHDVVGQTLALAQLKSRRIEAAAATEQEDLRTDASELQVLIENAIEHTRALTAEISPPVLYELGLSPAVQWLADRFREQHHLDFRVMDDRLPKPLSHEARVVLFHAVRELFFNVVKHAQATECRARIARQEGVVRVEVSDNGCGFEQSPVSAEAPRAQTGGFGLFSIRERLVGVGGSIRVRSSPRDGTTVELAVPLAKVDPATSQEEQARHRPRAS